MAFRKEPEGRPLIESVSPQAAIPGGDFQIRGRNFVRAERPKVMLGEVAMPVVIGSSSFLVARVPEGASVGEMVIQNGDDSSAAWSCEIGIPMCDGVHPVANPVVDSLGNVYTTFSGSPGQKAPVAVYRIDTNHETKPFVAELMNATGLAFDSAGILYVSSRFDGIVYQVTPNGNMAVYVEGMGVATGLAFDREENLYVGDRSGTIFKISRSRQIYVFCTLEPSIAAYHLCFGPEGHLYVTGPTTSSYDVIYRISPHGESEVFYRGLGRPQGMAFDVDGNLYCAASMSGRKGVVRIPTTGPSEKKAELFASGPNIVGLAFTPSKAMVVATNNSLFRLDVNVRGRMSW